MRTQLRGRARAGHALIAAALLAVLSACGGEEGAGPEKPDELTGAQLAEKANAQLEKQDPRLDQGTLTCDDVAYEIGAEARCLRTVVLPDGRLVRIGATATIARTTGGGRFEIQLDEEAEAFGITGKAVAADLAAQYARRFDVAAPPSTCPPYLDGTVGTKITCLLETDRGRLPIEVTVRRVEPETYETEYTFQSTG